MKTLYLIITLLSITYQANAQTVVIPDQNFKNRLLYATCIDTDGDGIHDDDADTNNDGEIQVSEAQAVLNLKIELSTGIVSLSGIEQFVNLEILFCTGTKITHIDLSQNTKLISLYCYYNKLKELDLTYNTNLVNLQCQGNEITTLNVLQNELLETLNISQNELISLDASQNPNLKTLYCFSNKLTSLNLKSGNNTLLTTMWALINPNLTCIQVDNSTFSTNASDWSEDFMVSYSENCGVLGIDPIETKPKIILYPNPVKTILNLKSAFGSHKIDVYNRLGQLVLSKTIENSLDISKYPSGLYVIKIEDSSGSFEIKKIIKN